MSQTSDLHTERGLRSVTARMVNGDVHSCEALPFDTIRRLKAQLATRTGVPAHQQRLLLGTELLKDRSTARAAEYCEREVEIEIAY